MHFEIKITNSHRCSAVSWKFDLQLRTRCLSWSLFWSPAPRRSRWRWACSLKVGSLPWGGCQPVFCRKWNDILRKTYLQMKQRIMIFFSLIWGLKGTDSDWLYWRYLQHWWWGISRCRRGWWRWSLTPGEHLLLPRKALGSFCSEKNIYSEQN